MGRWCDRSHTATIRTTFSELCPLQVRLTIAQYKSCSCWLRICFWLLQVTRKGSAQADADTAGHVLIVIGDIASAGLSEDEERTDDALEGTVLQVMAPSGNRVSTGFVLSPFTIPPHYDFQHVNTTVHVMSSAKNLYEGHDVSDTMPIPC